jgi:hypothetical protein
MDIPIAFRKIIIHQLKYRYNNNNKTYISKIEISSNIKTIKQREGLNSFSLKFQFNETLHYQNEHNCFLVKQMIACVMTSRFNSSSYLFYFHHYKGVCIRCSIYNHIMIYLTTA